MAIKFLALCVLGITMHTKITAQTTSSADSILLKKRVYKISITTSDAGKVNGYLANLSVSNLYLSPSPLPFSLSNSGKYLSSYSYEHLEKIEIKRKAAAGHGAVHGALIGLTAGIIAGFASGSDPVSTYNNPDDPFGTIFTSVANAFRMTAGEKAMIGGLTGAATGALIGAVVGSLVKKKFILGRKKEKFEAMRQDVLAKLYIHQQKNP